MHYTFDDMIINDVKSNIYRQIMTTGTSIQTINLQLLSFMSELLQAKLPGVAMAKTMHAICSQSNLFLFNFAQKYCLQTVCLKVKHPNKIVKMIAIVLKLLAIISY